MTYYFVVQIADCHADVNDEDVERIIYYTYNKLYGNPESTHPNVRHGKENGASVNS